MEEFLSSSLKKLKNGKVIMFFPEGKIINDGKRDKPRPGIGYLIEKSSKPILPLHIEWGKNKALAPKKLKLSFGKLLSFQNESGQLNSYGKTAEKIMANIYSL